MPGTGSPEPGGLLPREALKALRMVAREGICGMEVVEIAPPYDVSDMTAQLGARAIMDVLGTLVEEGHLGKRPTRQERERKEHEAREQERRQAEDRVSWLGDKRAVAVLSFDVDAESPILAEGRRYAAHAMVMTHQAYGPLVGVPRLLELLADYGLPATFFVPGLTAERYPRTVELIVEAGHEVGHHSYSHRSPVDLTADEERADFERALAALERVGVKPSGHRAAMWEASWRTPGLVAEYGLTLRLEPDGLRPALPAASRRRDDRRAPAPLEPRRLGAVRVPAAPGHRGRHRVARQGARDVAGASSTPCAATDASSCSPAIRSCRVAPAASRRCGG